MFDNGMFLEHYAKERCADLRGLAAEIRRGSMVEHTSLRVRFGIWIAERGVRLAGIRERLPRNPSVLRRALANGCPSDA